MESKLLTAKAVFDHALEIESRAERKAYVDQACADAPEVKQKVESLLDAYAAAGSFLEGPIPAVTIDEPGRPINEGPGSKIGPYKLLQKLGEGGMGVVYMAEQEKPVRRRVALKIIKPGMDSAQVIARFEAERQALALMDHNNIARVLDADTTESGRPYFVMELVHGVPITKYCDDHHLTPRERLELLVPVCQAIQHAHQKGIIHRDIKPSNVMVCLYDGKPVPKVIDFGVAKATDQRLTERTMFTQYGAIIGTFEYMSPEQAEMSQLGVDTRSDIYSLGVLMYELLTGDTPLSRQRLREAAFDEVLRLIREEEAPRPSTRLSGSGAALATISAQRHTEPAKLTKLMRGELDWIVMKALEKDRTRRYDSASGLAKDIERYLQDEPVEACPPSALYRLRKMARRHKTAFTVSVVMGCTVVMFILLQTYQVIEANQARADAEAAREDEKTAKDAAQDLAREKEQTAQDLAGALVSANKAKNEAEDARKAEAKEKSIAMAMAMAQVQATRSAAQAYQKLKVATDDLNRNLYFSRIALAEREFIANNVDRARDSLDKCPPELRQWEWHYLQRLSGAEMLTRPHASKVMCVAFSPDGMRLAAGGGDFKVAGESTTWDAGSLLILKDRSASVTAELKIWDANTGQKLADLPGHENPIYSVAFTPDGKRLVSAGLDKTVKIWDTATWKEVKALTAPAEVMRLAVSPDNKYLATLAINKLTLWNMETWEPGSNLPTLKFRGGIAFSPDSQDLAFVHTDNTIKLLDVATGQEKKIVFAGHAGFIHSIAFRPDGHRLAAASQDRVIYIWDAKSGKVILRIASNLLNANSMAFSPDGRQLVLGGHDKSIQIWDAESGNPVRTLRGHTGFVQSVALNRDGTRLASASFDKTVKVWNPSDDPEVRVLPVKKGVSFSAGFSPDGKHLAVSRALPSHVLVLDVQTGKEIKKLTASSLLAYTSATFSPDGKQVAGVTSFPSGDVAWREKAAPFGITGGRLSIWDRISGAEVFHVDADFGHTPRLAYSPDPKRPLLAVGGGLSTKLDVKVYDPAGLKLVKTLPVRASSVAFSSDARFLAAGSGDIGKAGGVRIWDTTTWQELPRLQESTERS